jgi:peroxiredoxin
MRARRGGRRSGEKRAQASASRFGGPAALTLCVGLLLVSASVGVAGTKPDPLQALGLQTPNEVVEAPAFALPDISGKTIALSQFRGKLVLLNFFATWCAPCREEMPGMERLYHAHRDAGFVVAAVNFQENAKTVRPFVQALKLSFPIVLDRDGAASREYGVRALPVTFLIGRDGNIVWRAMGGRDWESVQARRYFAQLVSGRP